MAGTLQDLILETSERLARGQLQGQVAVLGPRAPPSAGLALGWRSEAAAALKSLIVSELGASSFPSAPGPVGPARLAAAQGLTPRRGGADGEPGLSPPPILVQGRGRGLGQRPGPALSDGQGPPLPDNHQLGAEPFHPRMGTTAWSSLWRGCGGGTGVPGRDGMGTVQSGHRPCLGHAL